MKNYQIFLLEQILLIILLILLHYNYEFYSDNLSVYLYNNHYYN